MEKETEEMLEEAVAAMMYETKETRGDCAKLRVCLELQGLAEKVGKLEGFLKSERFEVLGEKQRELLKEQYQVMLRYVEILRERLEIW